MEAQEALAREFQPSLEVRMPCSFWSIAHTLRAGTTGGEQTEQQRYHRRICKGRSNICCEDDGESIGKLAFLC